MKILYSHRTRAGDGQYVHIRELTDAVTARGHEVIMAGPDGSEQSGPKKLDASEGRSFKKYLPNALYEFAELAYSAPAYWRLRRLCAQVEPDILYQRYNLFYYPGAWLRRAKRVPFILEVNAPLAEERARHGGLSMKRFAVNCEREIWRAADMVLPVTNTLAEKVRACGVSEEKITVIQNGVSDEFLKEQNPQTIRRQYGLEDKMVLGFAGFVRDWHGVDRAVRFIAAQKRSDLHLLIVGDGPAREEIEKLSRRLEIEDQLTVTGVIQRGQMPEFIAAFDIALQPAVVEYASPLKLFEYMALGKAIVAPASANICEIITDEKEALLFKAEPNAFDAALETLINERELCKRLGAAARARLMKDERTWGANARRVERIAEQLLDKNI